jgi:plastocyanin
LTRNLNYGLLKLMNDPKLKYLLAILGVVSLVAVAFLFVYQQKKNIFSPPKETPPDARQQTAPPTLSPEQIEIISKKEAQTVEIINGQFNPQILTIKTHEQVKWQNKDGKTHKIIGEGWSTIPIEDGESFILPFNNPGTYSYYCAFHPEMKGTIIVE